MKVLIVEDEKLAADRLQLLLNEYDSSIKVMACLDSVEDTLAYLKTKPHPDVILMDIHLSDGHSFEVFKQFAYHKPVIFTTAYDEYALDAFKMFSIDYILKPVTQEALATALNKLKYLSTAFAQENYTRLDPEWPVQHFKKRFLGKIGQRLFFVNVDAVSFFYALNKVVQLVDKEGHRYVVDSTIEKLATQIDPAQFFRANRSHLVHINAIDQIKPYFNNRLRLWLKGASSDDEIVVSRERVAEFKSWADS